MVQHSDRVKFWKVASIQEVGSTMGNSRFSFSIKYGRKPRNEEKVLWYKSPSEEVSMEGPKV